MVNPNIGALYRPTTLGFESILKDIERVFEQAEKPIQQTYPPHNIILVDDNQYVVELAIAGFNKNEIDITVQDGYLTIKGEKSKEETVVKYLHRGIGTRAFTKTIKIADTIEVGGAEFKDGILRIGLVNIVPDHKKLRKINIEDSLVLPAKTEKTLLTE